MAQELSILPLDSTEPLFSNEFILSGSRYELTFDWEGFSESWFMSVADEAGQPIVSGIRVVLDTPLLFPYGTQGGRLPPGDIVFVDKEGVEKISRYGLGREATCFYVVF